MEKKISSVSFTSLNIFMIFHFKNVLREVRRKVVIGPMFSMDRGFMAKLCL